MNFRFDHPPTRTDRHRQADHHSVRPPADREQELLVDVDTLPRSTRVEFFAEAPGEHQAGKLSTVLAIDPRLHCDHVDRPEFAGNDFVEALAKKQVRAPVSVPVVKEVLQAVD